MKLKASSLCLLAGAVVALVPVVLGFLGAASQRETVASYETRVASMGEEQAGQILDAARQWDAARAAGVQTGESYEEVLDFTGTGIMGSLAIPKIGVSLPIYHGTGEEALSAGAGHLESSDLPLGGAGTRSVLSAHRGLPAARLFTRLDELEPGDLFFVNTGPEKLAYEVTQTEIIEPEQADRLLPVPGQDLVSLVTCTPYGINTHRLVVTGKRVAAEAQSRERILPAMPGLRELGILCLPGVFLAAAFVMHGKERR